MRANLNQTGPRFRIPLPHPPSEFPFRIRPLAQGPWAKGLGGGRPSSRREVGGRDRGCLGPRAPSALPGGGLAEGEEKRRRKKRKNNPSGIITNRG